jgi:hypothetical protein
MTVEIPGTREPHAFSEPNTLVLAGLARRYYAGDLEIGDALPIYDGATITEIEGVDGERVRLTMSDGRRYTWRRTSTLLVST